MKNSLWTVYTFVISVMTLVIIQMSSGTNCVPGTVLETGSRIRNKVDMVPAVMVPGRCPEGLRC